MARAIGTQPRPADRAGPPLRSRRAGTARGSSSSCDGPIEGNASGPRLARSAGGRMALSSTSSPSRAGTSRRSPARPRRRLRLRALRLRRRRRRSASTMLRASRPGSCQPTPCSRAATGAGLLPGRGRLLLRDICRGHQFIGRGSGSLGWLRSAGTKKFFQLFSAGLDFRPGFVGTPP
jgi:hypothetical protein